MGVNETTTIRTVEGEPGLSTLRELFVEYHAAIGVDLCFQGFESEVRTLPGAYAAPQGLLLLAERSGRPAGCVAMRPINRDTCEMKRMYVRPEFRGLRIARLLAERLIAEARRAGYRRMVLDTLSSMTEAQTLYRSLGFRHAEAYTYNPLPGAMYFALELGAPPVKEGPSDG